MSNPRVTPWSEKRETLTLIKRAEVRRLDHESDWHYEARSASIRALGKLWCRHPQYASPARHSVLPAVWESARADYLAEISRRAAADRSRNPAHLQWEKVRAVLGEQA